MTIDDNSKGWAHAAATNKLQPRTTRPPLKTKIGAAITSPKPICPPGGVPTAARGMQPTKPGKPNH